LPKKERKNICFKGIESTYRKQQKIHPMHPPKSPQKNKRKLGGKKGEENKPKKHAQKPPANS